MQSETWAIQIGNLPCHFEVGENDANTIDEFRQQASPIPIFVEPSEVFVTKVLDHVELCKM